MSLLKEQIELKIAETEAEAEFLLNKFPKWEKWVIVICLIGTIPAYIISRNFSHKLWQEQYSKYKIFAKASYENPKGILQESFDLTTTSDGTYTAVATLQNENLDLSAKTVNYEFQFFNSQGKIVSVFGEGQKGKTFFLPNEKKYLVMPKFTALEPVVSGKVVFEETIKWQKKVQIPKVKITSFAPNLKNQISPVAFILEGSIKNDSPYQVKTVKLTFLVFNKDKKIIAASSRTENDLTPNEKRTVKQIWPNIFTLDALNGKIIAETNSLDADNLKLTNFTNASSSDLDRPQADTNQ